MTAFLFFVLAAAPVDLTWGTGPQGLQRLAATPDDKLLKQVLAVAKSYKVQTIERRGAEPKTEWSAADPASDTMLGVSRPERLALLSMIGRQARGAEFDLLIPQPDGTFVPVSVWWETPDVVSFLSGPTWSHPAASDVTPAKLKERFKTGEFLEADATWNAISLSAIEAALTSLTADELALVKGLHFRRKKADDKRMALYERGDDTNLINVFDAAFLFDDEQFVGEPTAPRSYLLIALLHELGHALADARLRERGIANLELRNRFNALKAQGKATDADFQAADGAVRKLLAIDAANAAGRPVERALITVFPQNKSPSPYGRTKPKEHFAETFTLWKNDPAALRRISSAAAAFFEAGRHVTIAGQPLEK